MSPNHHSALHPPHLHRYSTPMDQIWMERKRPLCMDCGSLGHGGHRPHGGRENTHGTGRNSCWLGAPRARDPRRVDDFLSPRTKVWRGAAARDRQLVWHNAAHLRSKSRRLAHSVERSRNIFFHAADCASSGWRHRAGRTRSERRRHALDIFRDPIRSFCWMAERAPDEKNWRKEVDIWARRAAATAAPATPPTAAPVPWA